MIFQIIDASGNPMQRTYFKLGAETEAYFGCSVIYKSETLVLGGKKESNQVSSRFNSLKINYAFISLAKLNLAEYNDMVIYHSLKICMHRFIVAFIISKIMEKLH